MNNKELLEKARAAAERGCDAYYGCNAIELMPDVIAALEAATRPAEVPFSVFNCDTPMASLKQSDAPQPADNPDADHTDEAHPAYWRGFDAGTAKFNRMATDILDGKDVRESVDFEGPHAVLIERLKGLVKPPTTARDVAVKLGNAFRERGQVDGAEAQPAPDVAGFDGMPSKLLLLADWIDLKHPGRNNEVQCDLRQLATALLAADARAVRAEERASDAGYLTARAAEWVISDASGERVTQAAYDALAAKLAEAEEQLRHANAKGGEGLECYLSMRADLTAARAEAEALIRGLNSHGERVDPNEKDVQVLEFVAANAALALNGALNNKDVVQP